MFGPLADELLVPYELSFPPLAVLLPGMIALRYRVVGAALRPDQAPMVVVQSRVGAAGLDGHEHVLNLFDGIRGCLVLQPLILARCCGL